MATQLPPEKRAHPRHPIFGPCLLWPNCWMDQDATWYAGKSRPSRRCVRWGWGRSSPLKGAQPQFSVHVYCGQTTGWMKTPLCTEVDLGPGHIVLGLSSSAKRAEPPLQLSAHVYCGRTPEWIKMSLGMEVGLVPVHIVLDEDPAPLPKKGAKPPPIFGPFLLWPNVWMHQDATSYGGRPQPGGLSVKWGPSHPSRKRVRSPH